jgi:N-acetylglucosamine kinase-like BadF-type ATPase
MYVLGIDGGGTKTVGVITDQKGNLLAHEIVGATNPNSVEEGHVTKELSRLFESLKKQNEKAFAKLIAVFAGMSGVDRTDGKQTITEVLEFLLPKTVKINVDHDGVNALFSGTLGQAGIVNIAGTGSITFGIDEYGNRKRAGGWGYLFGDRGSGFSIGRDALQHAFDAYDGCGKETLLTQLIEESTFSRSLPELIPSIYKMGEARKLIAPLSQIVVQAADQGDEIAQYILEKAAKEMVIGIRCLLTHFFRGRNKYLKSKIPVVLTGGVYRRSDWFIPTIEKELASEEQYNEIDIVVPVVPPVAGGLAAAWRSVDVEVSETFMNQLHNSGLTNE